MIISFTPFRLGEPKMERTGHDRIPLLPIAILLLLGVLTGPLILLRDAQVQKHIRLANHLVPFFRVPHNQKRRVMQMASKGAVNGRDTLCPDFMSPGDDGVVGLGEVPIGVVPFGEVVRVPGLLIEMAGSVFFEEFQCRVRPCLFGPAAGMDEGWFGRVGHVERWCKRFDVVFRWSMLDASLPLFIAARGKCV